MNAICTGCGIKSDKTGCYSKDDTVESDGTYRDGKFVCTPCYMKLISLGLDVGNPDVIQKRANQVLTRTVRQRS